MTATTTTWRDESNGSTRSRKHQHHSSFDDWLCAWSVGGVSLQKLHSWMTNCIAGANNRRRRRLGRYGSIYAIRQCCTISGSSNGRWPFLVEEASRRRKTTASQSATRPHPGPARPGSGIALRSVRFLKAASFPGKLSEGVFDEGEGNGLHSGDGRLVRLVGEGSSLLSPERDDGVNAFRHALEDDAVERSAPLQGESVPSLLGLGALAVGEAALDPFGGKLLPSILKHRKDDRLEKGVLGLFRKVSEGFQHIINAGVRLPGSAPGISQSCCWIKSEPSPEEEAGLCRRRQYFRPSPGRFRKGLRWSKTPDGR